MINFDAGLVGELTVTQADVQKTVGNGRYWPRQAHGLKTGAWSFDGLWMPCARARARVSLGAYRHLRARAHSELALVPSPALWPERRSHAPAKTRVYPWGDKCRSTLVLGTDRSDWSTTQADILKPPSEAELLYARQRPASITGAVPGASERKGALKLDQSPYNAMTGLRKASIAATQRLAVPGKRVMAARTVADDVSDQLDSTLLATRPDPRTALATPLSEVRDHFRDPEVMRATGMTVSGPNELRYLGERKYVGKSAGPPGY